MQGEEWSLELVEKIEKFQRLEEQYRLTLSALREGEIMIKLGEDEKVALRLALEALFRKT